jgi:2-methylisocitrate lyase-like PEP mutase family enzyme
LAVRDSNATCLLTSTAIGPAHHSCTRIRATEMKSGTPGIADKRRSFVQLHEQGCFVIPNPWDVGSARVLEGLGSKALATTSAGLAWSRGLPDNGVGLQDTLAHLREMVEGCSVPVSADFGNGFAATPAGVAANVRLALDTGIAGLSIEDSTGEPASPLFAVDEACARIRAARAAIDAAGSNVVLVARAECFFIGLPDLAETIARLKAYSAAGADCLYAPGLRTAGQIAAVVSAVAPKPVNVLADPQGDLTVRDLAALGVRRISVGGALARVAWDAFIRAAATLVDTGNIAGLATTMTGSSLNRFFKGQAAAGDLRRATQGE